MSDTFEVHAGWLKKPERIGNCYIERTRGNEVISFSFDVSWLFDGQWGAEAFCKK